MTGGEEELAEFDSHLQGLESQERVISQGGNRTLGLGDGALQAAESLEKGQKTCSDFCELEGKGRNR